MKSIQLRAVLTAAAISLLAPSLLLLAPATARAGGWVEGGDRLGAVGTTGRRSAAEPHLHFGVREADNRFAYHDPLDFLPPLAAPPGLPAPAPVPVPVGEPARPDPSPAGAA